MTAITEQEEQEEQVKKNVWLRVGLLLSIIIGLVALYKYTVVGEWMQPERLKVTMQEAGSWGLLLFFAVVLAGTLMNVPGAVFLVFAVLVYGYLIGALVSYIAFVGASMINFYFARAIGGKALNEVKNERMRRVLEKVEEHPVRTICTLRLFFLLSPIVNYALALSNIKSRQFLIGNSIAMIIPLTVILGVTAVVRSDYFNAFWMALFG